MNFHGKDKKVISVLVHIRLKISVIIFRVNLRYLMKKFLL